MVPRAERSQDVYANVAVISDGYRSLHHALQLTQHSDLFFEGRPMPVQWGVPFGGLLVAQAIAAASRATTEHLSLRSMHAYFVGVGDDEAPVDLRVHRISDSRSSSWKSVDLQQHGAMLLHATTLFSTDRPGPEHAIEMPQVPNPDTLKNLSHEVKQHHDAFIPWNENSAFDIRYIMPHPRIAADEPGVKAPRSQVWLRARGPDTGDPQLAIALLAYASDMCMLDACLRPANLWFGPDSAGGLSLDHSMWIYAPIDLDDWLLLDLHSPAMRGGRGLGRADIFTRSGQLVCSVAQLGMIRPQNP